MGEITIRTANINGVARLVAIIPNIAKPAVSGDARWTDGEMP